MGGGMMGGGMMGRGMPVQKAKNFKGTFHRLLSYLVPSYTLSLLMVVVAAILSALFTTLAPKILGLAVTKISDGVVAKMKGIPGAHIDFHAIAQILLGLVVLYVISAIFTYIQQYVMAIVAQKTVYHLRKDVEEKLSRLPLKFFDSHPHGDILSRAVNDLDIIGTTLQQSLLQLITSIVTVVGVVVLMFTISWVLSIVTLATLPLSIFVTTFVIKRSRRYFMGQQRTLGGLNGYIEEIYAGQKIIKAFGHEQEAIARFEEMNDELYNQGWKAQFISGLIMPVMLSIGNIGYVLIAVIGGIMVAQRTLAIGDLQAFIQYARQFSMPITQLSSISNIIQAAIAAAERVFELLDEEEEIPETDAPRVITEPQGIVQFEHVKFGYQEDTILMENLDINVTSGQTIAIVGPTGAGKTTLVNLLMRFYELNSGRILVDGVDITELKRSDLRHLFGMVLQDTWLFKGTIRDNIAYGRDGATEEEIIQASRAAQADHFIKTLPEGYDTVLNQDATNLSQGQKQLLTIARAVLADPAILILDEATSSVDTRTEVSIQKAMSELMRGRTSFVIAHRLSTIRDADLILVMNHGAIIEQGTHVELLEQNGFYADLYNSQFARHVLLEEAV